MFRPLAAIFSAILMVAQPMVAKAVVGDDYTRAKRDLFCPAFVSRVIPIHQIDRPSTEHDLGTDSDFAVILSADQAKSIGGVLKILAKDLLFKTQFAASLVQQVTITTTSKDTPATSVTQYEAPPLFVRLPSAMALDAVWVDDPVSATGQPLECATLAKTYSPNLGGFAESRMPALSDSDIRKTLALPALKALSIGTVDLRNCPAIKVEARPSHLEFPNWPEGETGKGTVVLKLALDANAQLLDITVLKSSGRPPMDREAMVSAAKTTYSAEQFLCTPVPRLLFFPRKLRPKFMNMYQGFCEKNAHCGSSCTSPFPASSSSGQILNQIIGLSTI